MEQIILNEDIGIQTLAGNTPLLNAGVAIPAFFEDEFSTATDNQQAVELYFYAGGVNGVSRGLGLFLIDEIAPAPKGIPRIRVTLEVSRSGVLVVQAVHLDNAKMKRVELGQIALKSK